MNPNHYETLGVPRDADTAAIQKARADERKRCAELCASFGCPPEDDGSYSAFAAGFNAGKNACAHWISKLDAD